MAASGENVRQEMPPPGGYKDFTFAGRKIISKVKGMRLFVGMLGFMTVNSLIHKKKMTDHLYYEVECREARLAIEPLLLAERHRLYLKQLRQNRELEADIMKDVPGWQLGTWYGEPVYHNLGNRFLPPDRAELFAHRPRKDYNDRATLISWE